jgi:hypothetical protein
MANGGFFRDVGSDKRDEVALLSETYYKIESSQERGKVVKRRAKYFTLYKITDYNIVRVTQIKSELPGELVPP